MKHKEVPISPAAERSQALEICAYLNKKPKTTESFNGSKGWLERFKTRYDLHNPKFCGESANFFLCFRK